MPEEKKEGEKEKEVAKIKEVKEAKETKEIKEIREIFDVLFHKKPAMLLVLLLQDKTWYPSALARESVQSYVYATEIIKQFEKEDLITCTQKGKRRIVKLTEKGDKVARLIREIYSVLAPQQAK